MIRSVSYVAQGSLVAIEMTDGVVWYDDAALPPDTEMRRRLAEWRAAGNTITPFTEPSPIGA